MYAFDSRRIVPGDTFICLPGGEKFCNEALKKGAKNIIHMTRKQLAVFAKEKYNHPDESLCIIGITGTNGKTSIAHFVHQALLFLNKKSLLLGTITHPLTTMESLDNYAYFAKHLKQEGSHVVMEVSSHGIDQYRIEGISFNVRLCSNISRDHLDYHKTFEVYKKTKLSFLNQSSGISIYPNDILNTKLPFKSHLKGTFNQQNLTAAYMILKACNINQKDAIKALKQVNPVAGRFEWIPNAHNLSIIIDYAHTPDGLKGLLSDAKRFTKNKTGKLIVLFGCGGNRDSEKRAMMGAIADKQSSVIILSNDNPRHEDPEKIISDIKTGIKSQTPIILPNRKKAIQYAFDILTTNDVLVIAGKGHESVQIIGNNKIPFSDKETSLEIIKQKYGYIN